jgi:short subunit dehydrogenase-like uncharacterized protein
MAEREYDVVLFGATGFTGALTAEYLAGNAPEQTRWALAGRSRAKLEQTRRALADRSGAGAEPALIEADISDLASLRRMAESTRVLITTVGPYASYGEPVVAACARAGTDYVDLAAEPEFVDRVWLAYHEQARATGARLVHSCGFDSIPYDLGALYTVEQLPEGVAVELEGFVRAAGTISGGTFQSVLTAFARVRQGLAVGKERRRREVWPPGRRVRGRRGRPHDDPYAGGWVVPLPTIDPQTVLRSARALDRFGPDFSYSHYLVTAKLPSTVALGAGAGVLMAAAQIPPLREALGRWKPAGAGPTPEQRARAWFKVKFRARTPATAATPAAEMMTEVSGGDPGYGETSKMLAESALCLAFDDLPERAGQLTPAVAMGDALIARLQRAGISFRVIDPAPGR